MITTVHISADRGETNAWKIEVSGVPSVDLGAIISALSEWMKREEPEQAPQSQTASEEQQSEENTGLEHLIEVCDGEDVVIWLCKNDAGVFDLFVPTLDGGVAPLNTTHPLMSGTIYDALEARKLFLDWAALKGFEPTIDRLKPEQPSKRRKKIR